MTLREELLRAGVPAQVGVEGALDVERVERNIAMSESSRIRVRADGGTIVFETVVGEPRRVEIEAVRLWDPAHGRPLTSAELRKKLAPLRRASGDDVSDEEVARAGELGPTVGVELHALSALLLLESIKGFGPQKFKDLYAADVPPTDVVHQAERLPLRGKRGDEFKRALAAFSSEDAELARRRAARQIIRASEHGARILTYGDPMYPANVYESNNPVPILYARGAVSVLNDRRAVACVGSRKIRPPYAELHEEFARAAIESGFTVVSGFALGADRIGHEAALRAGGRTIGVMPSGLDRPFPPENRSLWDELLEYPRAVFVSEFPFGTAASALTLRKRNKLIVAFALGVLVSQSSARGGAMNAYRFALEQRKPVATFASDRQPDASGNNFIVEQAGQEQPGLAAPESPELPAHPDPEQWKRWLRALSSST